MRIYFLHHSAVCVVLGEVLLVFDYYIHKTDAGLEMGAVSADDIAQAKRVYVFVSHAHHDHFNPRIFEWAAEHVRFILDDTVPTLGAPEGAVFMHRGQEYDDGYIHVREFGSTDMGGSFCVTCEGLRFFHAGDYNDWHWKDNGNERYSRVMSRLFERELRHIKRHAGDIDYAFFPLDRRMGTDYDTGANRFIEEMQPKVFVPIHFMAFEDTLKYSEKTAHGSTRVLAVNHNGERLV